MKDLPDKMSELLIAALSDLRKCERSSKYKINMACWHKPQENEDGEDGGCLVCLAGAMMAKHLGVAPDIRAFPSNLLGDTAFDKMLALDNLQRGQIGGAYEDLDRPFPDGLPLFIPIKAYHEDRLGWWKDMRNLVKMIQKEEKC
jgi:hypothetical protein